MIAITALVKGFMKEYPEATIHPGESDTFISLTSVYHKAVTYLEPNGTSWVHVRTEDGQDYFFHFPKWQYTSTMFPSRLERETQFWEKIDLRKREKAYEANKKHAREDLGFCPVLQLLHRGYSLAAFYSRIEFKEGNTYTFYAVMASNSKNNENLLTCKPKNVNSSYPFKIEIYSN